jgi:hypothetical protein
MLALAVPSIALAANTATFSSKAPVAGSMSANAKPTISVAVTDRYGVKSGGYSMTLNGVKVGPIAISYSTRYSKFKVTYKAPTALPSGLYTVAVRIKDVKSKISTTSWSFTIDTTPPTTTSDVQSIYRFLGSVHLTATDNPGGSGVAHTYYILNGFQSEGNIVSLSDGTGTYTLEYWSVDNLGNVEPHHHAPTITAVGFHAMPVDQTPACFGTGCHTGNGDIAYIHMAVPGMTTLQQCGICHANVNTPPTAECNTVGCHSASDAFPAVGVPHTNIHVTTALIGSTGPTDCTQSTCHGTNAVTIHGSNCAVCHAPTANAFVDPALVSSVVASGLAGPLATCEDCHTTSFAVLHATGNSPHNVVLTNTCVTPVCHDRDASVSHVTSAGPDVTVIPGCTGSCHQAGKTLQPGIPSCTIAGCHPTGVAVHPGVAASHASTNTCAAGGSCHGTDVAIIHTTQLPGGTIAPPGCIACHNTGVVASTNCQATGCHDGITLPANPHAGVPVPQHSQYIGGCMSASCHSTDISLIHGGGVSSKRPGCSDCHSASQSPTLASVVASYGTTWNSSAPCATCHPSLNSPSTDPHVLITSNDPNGHHSTSTGLVCSQCHDQTSGLKACNTPGCHLASFGTITRSDATTYTPTTLGNEFGPGAASQHNATGNPGGLTKFDGSQGVTLRLTDGSVLNSTWATPTVNVFKPGAKDDSGNQLGWNSVVTCQDCHTGQTPLGAVGPHGSSAQWLLDPAYPYPYTLAVNSHLTTSGIVARMNPATVNASQVGTDPATGNVAQALANAGLVNAGTPGNQYAVICAKCHQLFDYQNAYTPGNYLPGSHGFTFVNATGIGNEANTAHSSHHFDLNNGAADCVNCHVAVPHGWTRPRLLVNGVGTPTTILASAGTATYTITVPTTTTITWTSDLYPYWQGRGVAVGGKTTGMGPLSSTDQHTLSSITTGGALWTEANCIACGTEHTGVSTDTAKLK